MQSNKFTPETFQTVQVFKLEVNVKLHHRLSAATITNKARDIDKGGILSKYLGKVSWVQD